jgi:hypothetical protein
MAAFISSREVNSCPARKRSMLANACALATMPPAGQDPAGARGSSSGGGGVAGHLPLDGFFGIPSLRVCCSCR